MAIGGTRIGGREKGTLNKRTAAIKAATDELLAAGESPLEFLLRVMRTGKPPEGADALEAMAFHGLRFEAAKAAAPYCHPKLVSTEVSGPGGGAITVEIVRFSPEVG